MPPQPAFFAAPVDLRRWLQANHTTWYEAYDDLEEARQRELQMKKWKRLWKLSTIEAMNSEWRDLYPTIV